jgi:predicted RND superfamily exporter protein
MSIADSVSATTDRIAGVVTDHNRLVILLMLVVTAGVIFGVTQEQGDSDNTASEDIIEGSEVNDANQYLEDVYFTERSDGTETVEVYVRIEDGSALSRDGLLAALDYQMEVTGSEPVTAALVETDGVRNPASLVATELAEESDPDLATQRAALETASSTELRQAVQTIFSGGEQSRQLLPATYETGTADADAMRLLVTLGENADPAVTDVLEEAAETVGEESSLSVFTSSGVNENLSSALVPELAWLVVPLILLSLVVVLGFAYRDLTDVIISLAGVIVTMLWAFGLMGWLGLFTSETSLVVPVLAIALSIDFSFHTFMRYRERRDPEEGIRAGLRRSSGAVMVAFLLVTITAIIGFLPNLVNPVPLIRDLSVALMLAVVSALVVFTTLVPALKVSADGLWERFGFDRTGTALGKGSHLSTVLGSGATAARRVAPVVIVGALLVGLAGGIAFTEVDREQFQESDPLSDPGWQSELPGPMAYELHETDAAERQTFINNQFRTAGQDTDSVVAFTQFLFRGDVATAETMQALATLETEAAEADPSIVFNQGGTVDVQSPLSAMQETAAARPDSEFAETFAAAAGAETSDPEELRTLVPAENVAGVLDAFFEVAPEEAGQVVERTDGEYASMRALVPVQEAFGDERTGEMRDIESAVAGETSASVTAVGNGIITDVGVSEIVDGITTTVLVALAGVFLVLGVVYRAAYGSTTLGFVTALPIALVLGAVFLGMFLLEVPLTANTALIVSIAIGLGIDYNIHISDRFATELERGATTAEALREATTGTGGALLGSAITSAGAFVLLLVVPLEFMSSMGTIVALTLGASFLLSVFVLPSLLYVWAQVASPSTGSVGSRPVESPSD